MWRVGQSARWQGKGGRHVKRQGTSSQLRAGSLLLDDQLCLALHRAARAIARVYGEVLKLEQITYPQYLVLICLLEEDGLTVGEIGRRLGLDSGTLTPLVKRLEAQSIVARQRKTNDERKVQVRLTQKGRGLRRLATRARQHVVAKLTMSDGEIAELRQQLQSMTGRLTSHPATRKPLIDDGLSAAPT